MSKSTIMALFFRLMGPTHLGALSHVRRSGARVQDHGYLKDVRPLIPIILIAVISQFVIYSMVAYLNGEEDISSLFRAMCVFSAVPIFGAVIIAGIKRQAAPLVGSAGIAITLLSIAITFVAALRIKLGFTAILSFAPVTVALMTYMGLMLNKSIGNNIALLSCDRADYLESVLSGVKVVKSEDFRVDDIDVLLIDPREHHSDTYFDILSSCYLNSVKLMPWTEYLEITKGQVDVRNFEIPSISYSPSQILYARTKRMFDLFIALATLPITAPIAILVGLYIWLRDGGPVIFVQIRRGLNGSRFRMYKFRTMYKKTSGGSTAIGDSRIIKGCEVLRKLRADELPQIFNIIRGDMSFIGPRPVAEYVAREVNRVENKFSLRTLVLPGITGWAQVKSGYAATTEEEIEKLSFDLFYIKHLSFDLDMRIIFETLRTVLFARGAR